MFLRVSMGMRDRNFNIIDADLEVSFTKKELNKMGVEISPVMITADEIKAIRKKLKLSQSVFAKLLNVPIGFYVRYYKRRVR